MSPEELDQLRELLPAFIVISMPLVGIIYLLHRGWIPFLRFRKPTEPREPPLWGWEEVLLSISVWYVSQILLAVIVAMVSPAGASRSPAFIVGIQVASTAITLAVLFDLVRRRLGQPYSALGLARTAPANLAPTIFLWIASHIPITTVWISWNLALSALLGRGTEAQVLVDLFEGCAREKDVPGVALLVFSGVIVAPLGEETLFRGILFLGVRSRWGPLVATLFSSVVFALFHGSLSAFVPLVVLGAILCYVVERTGSLYPAMVFHGVFNSVTFFEKIRQAWA